MKRLMSLICVVGVSLVLSGCYGESGTETEGNEKPAATQSSSTESSTSGDAILAAYVLEDQPADAKSLIHAKTTASKGDEVVLTARVGGRPEPFIEGRAMMFVVDPVLKSCDQLHGDACKIPWDYCCEPKDNLRRNMATVQLTDADGKVLPVSMETFPGLDPLDTIEVVGVVDQVDMAGNFVVTATGIHVRDS